METLHNMNGEDEEPFDSVGIEAPWMFASAERRLHARARAHWESLLGERDLPSIADVDPIEMTAFSDNSALIDLASGTENPAVIFIGAALREECGISGPVERMADLPAECLLSRLQDHFAETINLRTPVSFASSCPSPRGTELLYRGIILPFSTSGAAIDFVYAVLSWKEAIADADAARLNDELADAMNSPDPQTDRATPWDKAEENDDFGFADATADNRVGEDNDTDGDALDLSAFPSTGTPQGAAEGDDDRTLYDRLDVARSSARAFGDCEGRSRAALYKAIGHAWDVALAARQSPEGFAALLEINSIVAQPRAPMTPVIKLIFGTDYDKTRVAEYAAVLDYAASREMAAGTLARHLEDQRGGLRAIVNAMRNLRDPDNRPASKRLERAQRRLARLKPLTVDKVPFDARGYAVAVVRIDGEGQVSLLGGVEMDSRPAQAVLIAATRRKRRTTETPPSTL